MEGIDDILVMLQPIAGNDCGAAAAERGIVGFDELALVHHFQGFVTRQNRLLRRRAHIGEDQPIAFLDGIPGLAHFIAKESAFRLAGLFETMALGIKKPAVIAAAYATLFHLPIIERRAAMRAARMDEAGLARPVSK